MEFQSRVTKSLLIEVVLDANNRNNPVFLCLRNAGIDADRMFASDPDEIMWVCKQPFTVTFVQVMSDGKRPLGSSPFKDWDSGQKSSTRADGTNPEQVVYGKIEKDKKGGSGRVWNYMITVEGAPDPLDPMIIIDN